MKITVVGTGYVGLSNALLFAKQHQVTALDIDKKRVEQINQKISPISDSCIQNYLLETSLEATTSAKKAYQHAKLIIIATPTNYDPETNYFDTSSIETVLEDIIKMNTDALIIIKSTVPVGYTQSIAKKLKLKNLIFSPEFSDIDCTPWLICPIVSSNVEAPVFKLFIPLIAEDNCCTVRSVSDWGKMCAFLQKS